jgi:hypothetical protein
MDLKFEVVLPNQKLTSFSGGTTGIILLTDASANSRRLLVVSAIIMLLLCLFQMCSVGVQLYNCRDSFSAKLTLFLFFFAPFNFISEIGFHTS